MGKIKWLKLIGAILLCELAGIVGSIATAPNIPTWYAALQKPFFAPPNWLFAPVWTTLFLLMGISLYLVLEKNAKKSFGARKAERKKVESFEWKKKLGLELFCVQLLLNIQWSFLFFGLRNPLAGFVEIILMWIFILATIIQFNKISRGAALLLVPYIVWVTIASALNFGVWVLN